MRLVDYLMNKTLYLGFRLEIANRFAIKGLAKKYNSTHDSTQIFDVHQDGKIIVEKRDSMIIAHGSNSDKHNATGLANFSLMAKISNDAEVRRIVQIVNVLGNDRLIRERVKIFYTQKSLLNAIPELDQLRPAFTDLEAIMHGFIKAGWYYAPEAIFL